MKMIGYLALPDGNEIIEDNLMLVSLSKNKTYMKNFIDFSPEEILTDPHIGKYSIFTDKKKMFNPWNNMHRFILCTALPIYFEIDNKAYDVESYLFDLKQTNNALLLEEKFIMEILYDLGFAGFHSDDRGLRLYNIFNPHLYLTFIEKQPYFRN
jgi:hypothetical protein